MNNQMVQITITALDFIDSAREGVEITLDELVRQVNSKQACHVVIQKPDIVLAHHIGVRDAMEKLLWQMGFAEERDWVQKYTLLKFGKMWPLCGVGESQ